MSCAGLQTISCSFNERFQADNFLLSRDHVEKFLTTALIYTLNFGSIACYISPVFDFMGASATLGLKSIYQPGPAH